MAAIRSPYFVHISRTASPRVTIKFRLLRDGKVTTTKKLLKIYRGWDTLGQIAMAFCAEPGSGEFTQTYSVDLATLLSQEDWLACGIDDAAPRKTRAVYVSLREAGTYLFNITNSDGMSYVSPATVNAQVRVDGSAADREVIVVERPSNGQWRVAGYGKAVDGVVDLELNVSDGQCYAVGFDDWGLLYQSGLSVTVGQTIRPTTYSGWLYRITQAGTLPATEPEWWPIDGDNTPRDLGTARAVAVRYYRPLAHGPVPVEMI